MKITASKIQIILIVIMFTLIIWNFYSRQGMRDLTDVCMASQNRIAEVYTTACLAGYDRIEKILLIQKGVKMATGIRSAAERFETEAKPEFERALLDLLSLANEAEVDAAEVIGEILRDADSQVYDDLVGE